MNGIGKYENISRGTIDFPMEYYSLDNSSINYIMKYHWHMDWEFIRINKGEFNITLNEINLDLTEGDILIIPGGILHGGFPKSDAKYECIVLHSSIIYNNNRLIKEQVKNSVIHSFKLEREVNRELCNIADFLFDAIKNKSFGYEAVSSGALILLIGKLMEKEISGIKGTEKGISNKRIDSIKCALKLIEEEYNSDISLNTLAKICGMSPRYFCEFFKEMTGRTPIDYNNRYRIECACNKLSGSKMNVTETATSCGFNDISYFIRTFKKYIGVTPKKYAARNVFKGD